VRRATRIKQRIEGFVLSIWLVGKRRSVVWMYVSMLLRLVVFVRVRSMGMGQVRM